MTLRLRILAAAVFSINAFALDIVPADLGIAVINRPYRVVMRVEQQPGVNYTGQVIWRLTGALPPGVAFANSEGSIGGTATATGAFPISVEAILEGTILKRNYTITVNPALRVASPAVLPLAVLNESYSVVFIAEGGKPPYVFDLVPPPTGLSFFPSGGLFGTPLVLGTLPVRLRLTDADGETVTRDYIFEVAAERPSPIVSDASRLVIDPARAVVSPGARFTVTAAKDRPFTVSIASSRGGDPPTWIRANLTAGKTPAEVALSVDPSRLPSSSETGTVTIGDLQLPFEVTVGTPAAAIVAGTFSPEWLAATAGTTPYTLSLDNPGAAALTVRASSTAPWLAVSPAEISVPGWGTANLTATVDGSKLKPGGQLGAVRLSSTGEPIDAALRVFGAGGQSQVALSSSGLTFFARSGLGSAQTQSTDVISLGAALMEWTAEVVAGQETFSLQTLGGLSTRTQSALLVVGIRADAAPNPGVYYGLVRVTAPGSSAQYLTLILVASADLLPELQLAPTTTLNSYTARVLASSTASVPFRLAVNALDGGNWLTAAASAGSASTAAPGAVAVIANPTGLAAGVYTGWVSVTADNLRVRSLPVRMAVPAPNCTAPSRLVVTPAAPASGFAARAGWPVRIEARVIDDCNRNAADAAVTAYFSSGDAPVRLRATSLSAGTYAGSWVPSAAAQSVSMTIRAVRAAQTDSMQVWGSVAANPDAPVLYSDGVTNNLHVVAGAPLAGGTIIAVYGSALANGTAAAGSIPLPTTLAGSRVLAGAIESPLFYASPGQINAQLPVELDPAHWHSVVVRSGAAYTQPATIFPTPASPGVAAIGDAVIAQHTDYSLVTAGSPARLGETVILYLVGMGATSPAVATGQLSPATTVTVAPEVRIDGQLAEVTYAGHTPGAIGLYQINCAIPFGAAGGNVTLTVTQNGVASNTSRIAVRRE